MAGAVGGVAVAGAGREPVAVGVQALVGVGGAVVVAVVADLRRPREAQPVEIVAVVGGATTGALGVVAVPVLVDGQALVDAAVAVVVAAVAPKVVVVPKQRKNIALVVVEKCLSTKGAE